MTEREPVIHIPRPVQSADSKGKPWGAIFSSVEINHLDHWHKKAIQNRIALQQQKGGK